MNQNDYPHNHASSGGCRHDHQAPAPGAALDGQHLNPGYPSYYYQDGTGYGAVSQTGYSNQAASWFAFRDPQYLKGFLVAAGLTLLVANPKVQKTVVKGLAKAWSGLQYGIEEVKEQINDIKAEMQFKQEQKASAEEGQADAGS